MRATNIKPISYLKANAAEVLKHLAEQCESFLITQDGYTRLDLRHSQCGNESASAHNPR